MQEETKITQRMLLDIAGRHVSDEEWQGFENRHSAVIVEGKGPDAKIRFTQQITYKAQGHSLKVEGTQPSGSGDTISNNSLNVFPAALWAIEHGRDLDDTFKSVGLLAGTARGPFCLGDLNMEFLQLRLYKCEGERNYLVGSRIGRVLFRSFWCDTKLKITKLKSYALGVARGLLCDNMHVPCINDICARVIELCEAEGLYEYHTKEQIAKASVLEFQSDVQDRCQVYEHPDTESDISDLLEVELVDFQSYRSYLRSWAWGLPLDPPEHQSVVDAMYRLDCM